MNKTTVFGMGVTSLAAAAAIWLSVEVSNTDLSTGLPKCESTVAEDSLKSIVADGVLGKLGTKVVLVEDKKTINRTEKELKCTATLILSQFGDRHVSYTITMRDDGRWLLRTSSY